MPSVPLTVPPKGMRSWCYDPPPLTLEDVEVWRRGWMNVRTIRRHGDPRMNVAGLYWRELRQQARGE